MTKNTSIDIYPVPGWVLIDVHDTGDKTIELGGKPFYLLGDNEVTGYHNPTNGTHPGIRPRWARVLATSDEAEEVGIRVGQDVLCDTMKWSRKTLFETKSDETLFFSRIKVEDILLVPED